MKSRNELAHDYVCAMLADHTRNGSGILYVDKAFAYADAFLAAAGEQGQEQREPDAVWEIDPDFVRATDPTEGWDACCRRLRAGRERVRLKVYVEEVE